MKRRAFIKTVPVAALLPSSALASTVYTVEQHIVEMSRAGAPYHRSGSDLGQNLLDIDWDLFEVAKTNADQAGITARDIYEALCDPQLTPDERIEAAMKEIEAAIAEKNPNWYFGFKKHSRTANNCECVVISAFPPKD